MNSYFCPSQKTKLITFMLSWFLVNFWSKHIIFYLGFTRVKEKVFKCLKHIFLGFSFHKLVGFKSFKNSPNMPGSIVEITEFTDIFSGSCSVII